MTRTRVKVVWENSFGIEGEINKWLEDNPTLVPHDFKIASLNLGSSIYAMVIIPYTETITTDTTDTLFEIAKTQKDDRE